MATFQIMPARTAVGEQIARHLHNFLPGVAIDPELCLEFLGQLVSSSQRDVYLVYRDDLPEGTDVVTALRDGFGATDSDRIVRIGASESNGLHTRPTGLVSV